jgi:hypothetical protein
MDHSATTGRKIVGAPEAILTGTTLRVYARGIAAKS